MFDHFPQSEFQIVGADGTLRQVTKGIFSPKMITLPDPSVIVEIGDELRRSLPNGKEEAFEVLDPAYFDSINGIPAHYQVKIRRKGVFNSNSGGNYNFALSGNARINIQSVDNSHNSFVENRTLHDLAKAIEVGVSNELERRRLLENVEALIRAGDDRPALLSAYHGLIASAANHMSIIAPFLPALAQILE